MHHEIINILGYCGHSEILVIPIQEKHRILVEFGAFLMLVYDNYTFLILCLPLTKIETIEPIPIVPNIPANHGRSR